MRHLLLTMAIGETSQHFLSISLPGMVDYARRIGADCRVITQSIYDDPSMVKFDKFQIRDYLERYDRVLFLDADVVIAPHAPDIFKVVPDDHFAAWDECSLCPQPELISAVQNHWGKAGSWTQTLLNAGILLASRRHAALFEPPPLEQVKGISRDGIFRDIEQIYLNWKLNQSEIPVYFLPVFWNWNPICGYIHPRAYFVHFLGTGFFEPWRDRLPPPQEPTAKRLRQMAELVRGQRKGLEPAAFAVDLCVTSQEVRSAVSLPHYFLPAGKYEVEFLLHAPTESDGEAVKCRLFGKKTEEIQVAEWEWSGKEKAVTRCFSTSDLYYPQFCLDSKTEVDRVYSLKIKWLEEL